MVRSANMGVRAYPDVRADGASAWTGQPLSLTKLKIDTPYSPSPIGHEIVSNIRVVSTGFSITSGYKSLALTHISSLCCVLSMEMKISNFELKFCTKDKKDTKNRKPVQEWALSIKSWCFMARHGRWFSAGYLGDSAFYNLLVLNLFFSFIDKNLQIVLYYIYLSYLYKKKSIIIIYVYLDLLSRIEKHAFQFKSKTQK